MEKKAAMEAEARKKRKLGLDKMGGGG